MMLTRRSLALGSAAARHHRPRTRPRGRGVAPAPAPAPKRTAKRSSTGSGSRCAPSTPTRTLDARPRRRPGARLRLPGHAPRGERSAHLGASSESAAAARAAHDVLVHYYPALAARLDADLATSYAAIGSGHARNKGDRIGAEAARDLVRDRADDGYLDPTIHYVKAAGPGVWQPTPPATDMLAAWLGSLRPLLVAPLSVSGPYSLASAAWAADYDEVRRLGSTTSDRAHGRPDGNRRLLRLQRRHGSQRRAGPLPRAAPAWASWRPRGCSASSTPP